jgi:5-formyltetrahydrofolate cyclo-ligase
MKVTKVFDDIIMQIDTEDKFFRNLTWKQLCTKSKKQIKLYMKIHPDSNVLGTPPKQQPKKQTPVPKPNKPDFHPYPKKCQVGTRQCTLEDRRTTNNHSTQIN